MFLLAGLKYGAIPIISLHNIVTPLVELGCDYFLLVVSTQPNIFIHKQNNHSIPQYITTSLLAHSSPVISHHRNPFTPFCTKHPAMHSTGKSGHGFHTISYNSYLAVSLYNNIYIVSSLIEYS